MSGVKGRSGGKRPNSGPKPKKLPAGAVVTVEPGRDPLAFLLSVMMDESASAADRLKAATAALPFTHAKPAGKAKDEKPSGGRFKSAAPPKLVVNNR